MLETQALFQVIHQVALGSCVEPTMPALVLSSLSKGRLSLTDFFLGLGFWHVLTLCPFTYPSVLCSYPQVRRLRGRAFHSTLFAPSPSHLPPVNQ